MTAIFGLCLLGSAALSTPVALKRATLAAFDGYVRAAEERLRCRLREGKNFLSLDDSPERRERVRRGEILIRPMTGDGEASVPEGLIHDWFGAVFIPGATLAQTFAVVHDYNRYKAVYQPGVVDSRLLSEHGTDYRFYLRLRRKEIVTVVIDSVYDAHFHQLDPGRWYTQTRAVRVNEVKDAGEPGERHLSPGEDHGFLWGVYAHSRFVERDGGVFIEMESIALTRNIPFLLRWLVQPAVRRIARDSMLGALRATRQAVLERIEQVRTASRPAGRRVSE